MLKVTVSSKGQVAIPKALRETLDLRAGTELLVEVQGQDLILHKTPKRDWRRWSGRFPRSGMLQALEAEHREEILRDQETS